MEETDTRESEARRTLGAALLIAFGFTFGMVVLLKIVDRGQEPVW